MVISNLSGNTKRMFTGIIETLGVVEKSKKEGKNIRFYIESSLTPQLKIDQSLAHDGVCLTVVEKGDGWYAVDAIDETLQKSNLNTWQRGKLVNLERAMKMGDRLDGHMVQGHVDVVATCLDRSDQNGSWLFKFQLFQPANGLLVKKGSICVNGISLTLVEVSDTIFSVAIIPYTYQHTNLKDVVPGHLVNIEFDIIGKYVQSMLKAHLTPLNI
jgi:riboflavin synthase